MRLAAPNLEELEQEGAQCNDSRNRTAKASDLAELELIDRYWRAANYLSVGQIYLLDNPLLREPLTAEHVKPRLLGHWGTTPGLNFIYAHLNRVIRARDLDVLYICGPGHGGPAWSPTPISKAPTARSIRTIGQDADGMRKLFRQFSFPGGIPSHVAPETPGSIHEGGELGYALVHAYGAAFDNPDLVVACVVGDGEAETGPLAAAWHSNKFLNPALRRRRAADPAPQRLQDRQSDRCSRRMDDEELRSLFDRLRLRAVLRRGQRAGRHAPADGRHARHGLRPHPRHPGRGSRADGWSGERPRWPMIVLRSPKGWTGPKEVDGKKVEGFWRSHQVPVANARGDAAHRAMLEEWMRSYRPEELFDADGALMPELAALAPAGERRMGANPHANGGLLQRELALPDWKRFALDVAAARRRRPARRPASWAPICATSSASTPRRAISVSWDRTRRPPTGSTPCSTSTDRVWMEQIEPYDVHLARDGRVMEVLSASISARAGWRAICSPAGTACSPATRPSSTSSTRWSTSTPSG